MLTKNRVKVIAIIGLGLIGGSLSKVLKGKGYKIIGFDKDIKTLKAAKQERVISQGFAKLTEKSFNDVDIVFICTPLPLIKTYINKISRLKLKKKIIVTDTGSTKKEICDYAERLATSASLWFIGGHPMAGTEKKGFTFSKKDLFKNHLWILTSVKINNQLIKELIKIIKKTGAKPIIISPDEHDKAVALVSHLPLLVSIALSQTVKTSRLMKTAAAIASSGFRDTTRISSANPEMNANLLLSNSKVLEKLLPVYLKELNNIFKMTKTKSKNLRKKLNTVSSWRNQLYSSKGNNSF